jgi:tungstate transport system ATP-binding protein
MSPPLLQARGLKIKIGKALLLNVPELDVNQGEIISLIGPNGAGKTTLLLALARLSRLYEGEVIFRGSPVRTRREKLDYRRRIAMVFQESLLFDTTVFRNVAEGLKIRGTGKGETETRVERQLERFGISALRGRSARNLSGGEAQRTSLARAFAVEPDIIFLDEPFAALDPPTRDAIVEDLEKALRETGTTAVIATHDRIEALKLSDRIAVMMGGLIVQDGSPVEVMNAPADESVASFVGAETILEGKVSGNRGGVMTIDLPTGQSIEAAGEISPGTGAMIFIRPENVTIARPEDAAATSARNSFLGRVEKITPAGFFHKIRINCGFPLVAYATHLALAELSIREGLEVSASFKATSIHVIKKKQERNVR